MQVLGPGNKPVPGAQVRMRFGARPISRKAEPLSGVADAKGVATFESPTAQPQGLETLGAVTAWSPDLCIATLMVKAGQNTLFLGPSGVARGMVVDGKGQPVANALVRLSGMSSAGGDARSGNTALFAKTDEAIFANVYSRLVVGEAASFFADAKPSDEAGLITLWAAPGKTNVIWMMASTEERPLLE